VQPCFRQRRKPDLPYKAGPQYEPVPAFSWTGLYAGGHIGFGSGRDRLSDPTAPGSASITTKGFLGGGQIGYNLQAGTWVFGIEADISGSDIDGTAIIPDGAGSASSGTSKIRWTSLVTGRIGYALGPWLPYVKGGVAFAGTQLSGIDFSTGDSYSVNKSRTGWTVGAGLEYALAGPWTIRLQYDYVHFGSKTLDVVDSTGTAFQVTSRPHIHQVKLGVNYLF